jgi:hypothetical protein
MGLGAEHMRILKVTQESIRLPESAFCFLFRLQSQKCQVEWSFGCPLHSLRHTPILSAASSGFVYFPLSSKES